MEILCVLVSIKGPFCVTLKHPGKKDMVNQGLFSKEKLRKEDCSSRVRIPKADPERISLMSESIF